MASSVPTLRFERELMRDGARMVIGVDEVGRGALAGPVGVGVSVVHEHTRTAPTGLKDSKLLTEQRREELYPAVQRWAREHAVGLATNDEIETIGIIRCLGLAASRAFEALLDAGLEVQDAVVILDGSHDWLTPALTPEIRGLGLRVVTRIKADRSCAAVAAASVLAKVERDRLMIAAEHYTPVDAALIPTGALAAVEATPFDFRTPRAIGERMPRPDGYDHNFALDGARPALRLEAARSGRVLTLTTTLPGLQLYSGSCFDGAQRFRDGVATPRFGAVALEAQHFPNAPNEPRFPSALLRPGSVYDHTTVYEFTSA